MYERSRSGTRGEESWLRRLGGGWAVGGDIIYVRRREVNDARNSD